MPQTGVLGLQCSERSWPPSFPARASDAHASVLGCGKVGCKVKKIDRSNFLGAVSPRLLSQRCKDLSVATMLNSNELNSNKNCRACTVTQSQKGPRLQAGL